MKIDYDEQVYDLDLEAITLQQAMVIQSYIGMSIQQLFAQFDDVEEDTPELLKAIACIYWLMKNQAGEKFPISDTDFPLVPFLTAFFTALKDAGLMTAGDATEGEGEAGPTSRPPGPASSASPPVLPSPGQNPNPAGEEVPAATTGS